MAKEYGLKSIAFPSISTGVYGYPVEEAAKIALGAGKKFENDFRDIRYVCFSKEDLEVYQKMWSELGNTG